MKNQIPMKIFRQNNIGKFLLVFAVFLGLLGSHIININQVWFYLTPLENLGPPPKHAVKIISLVPIYDYAINKYRTYVFVQTEGNEVYHCCSWHDTKDWVRQDNYHIGNKQDELTCAKEIEMRWNISKNQDKVVNSLSLGWCGDSTLDQYSSYQIEQNGNITGRTVRENPIIEVFDSLRALCIFPISLIIFGWAIFLIYKKKVV